jgi:hypothetical protein
VEKLTVTQIKAVLDETTDNITESALRLGCARETSYWYIDKYPELQTHRKSIVAAMNDMAESTVKHAVAAKQIGPAMKWLEKHHPDWTNKQTIEHTGSVNLTAGLIPRLKH